MIWSHLWQRGPSERIMQWGWWAGGDPAGTCADHHTGREAPTGQSLLRGILKCKTTRKHKLKWHLFVNCDMQESLEKNPLAHCYLFKTLCMHTFLHTSSLLTSVSSLVSTRGFLFNVCLSQSTKETYRLQKKVLKDERALTRFETLSYFKPTSCSERSVQSRVIKTWKRCLSHK